MAASRAAATEVGTEYQADQLADLEAIRGSTHRYGLALDAFDVTGTCCCLHGRCRLRLHRLRSRACRGTRQTARLVRTQPAGHGEPGARVRQPHHRVRRSRCGPRHELPHAGRLHEEGESSYLRCTQPRSLCPNPRGVADSGACNHAAAAAPGRALVRPSASIHVTEGRRRGGPPTGRAVADRWLPCLPCLGELGEPAVNGSPRPREIVLTRVRSSTGLSS